MADININTGNRYTFGRFANATQIVDSTDSAEGCKVFAKQIAVGTGAQLYADTAQFVTRPMAITNNADQAVYMVFNNSTTGFGYTKGGLIGIDENENFRLHGYASNCDQFNVYLDSDHELQLTNAGDLHVTGDVIAYSSTTSDMRLKKNIRPLSSSLETICKLDGIKFDWKYRDDTDIIGLIAQQVEKHIPEIVKERQLPMYASGSYIKTSDPDVKDHIYDETEYKTVRYEQLIPHLIESIKELKSEIDELKIKLENKI